MGRAQLVADSTGALRWNTPDSLPPREVERAIAAHENMMNRLIISTDTRWSWVVPLVIMFFVARKAGRYPTRWLMFLPLVLLTRLADDTGGWFWAFVVVLLGYWSSRGRQVVPVPQPLHWGIAAFVAWVLLFTAAAVAFVLFVGGHYIELFFYRGFFGQPYSVLVLSALATTYAFRTTWPVFGRPTDGFFGVVLTIAKATVQIFTLRGWYRVFTAIPIVLVGLGVWWGERLLGPHATQLHFFVTRMFLAVSEQLGKLFR